MIKLAFDLDGVFCNFNLGYAKALEEVNGTCLLPTGWKTDPSFPPVWAWERHFGYTPEVEQKTWLEHIIAPNNFWMRLKPLPHARETLMFLDMMAKFGHADIYFLTNRIGNRVKWQTEAWLYENGISFPTVLIGSDKVPMLRLLQPALFIDDLDKTIVDVAAAIGMEKWPTRLFIKDAPYNKHVQVGERVESVKECLEKAGLWT